MSYAEARERISKLAASGGWIQTYGGRRVNILPDLFDIDQVHFDDVALALPHINRYAGHTPYPYSVAQHCIALAKSFKRQREAIERNIRATSYSNLQIEARVAELGVLERWAFIHDWAEYATNDIPAPFKRQMPELAALDERLTNAVARRNGLPTPMPIELMEMDRRLCRNEMDVFGSPHVHQWWLVLERVDFTEDTDFLERSVADVRAEFIAYAAELGVA